MPILILILIVLLLPTISQLLLYAIALIAVIYNNYNMKNQRRMRDIESGRQERMTYPKMKPADLDRIVRDANENFRKNAELEDVNLKRLLS